MRDIRGDLQDRASFLEEQISAAQAQFEKRMELFTREHESKIADLQAELEAVSMLMEREYRRIMSAPEVEEERRQAASQPAPEAQPVAAAEEYVAHDYLVEEIDMVVEEEPYQDIVPEAEPAPEPEPVEEEAPARRASEPKYVQRPAPEQTRMRRPVAVEQPDGESRPAPQSYSRPAARSVEPQSRSEAQPRREVPQRHESANRGPAQAQRPPLADFLIRKLGEVGHMSLDDLCGIAIREGYFAEGDNPDRTVHMTLMNVVKAGFIRQMPNGTFAPASVMDTIRLRRAI